MKKGLFFSAIMLLVVGASAQKLSTQLVKETPMNAFPVQSSEVVFDTKTNKSEGMVSPLHANKTTGGIVDAYLSFTDFIYSINGTYLGNYGFTITPDSTLNINYTSGWTNNNLHGSGLFYQSWWNGWGNATYAGVDSLETLIIDTVIVGGSYQVHNAAQTGDKLRVTLFNSDNATGDTSFSGVMWPAGTFPNLSPLDTPVMANLKYYGNPAHGVDAGSYGATNIYQYEITLTINDTIAPGFLGYYAIPLGTSGLQMPSNRSIGIFVDFIPGNAPSFNDTVDLVNGTGNVNTFRQWYYGNSDQADNNAYFIEFWDQTWNNSSIMHFKDARYAAYTGADNWRNSVMSVQPSYGSNISFHVKGQSHLSSPEFENNISYQLFPNPNNGEFSIRFGDVTSGDYTVSVVNVIGQEVHQEMITINSNEEVQFNLTGVESGMYLLNISGNGYRSAQKITIK